MYLEVIINQNVEAINVYLIAIGLVLSMFQKRLYFLGFLQFFLFNDLEKIRISKRSKKLPGTKLFWFAYLLA